MESVEPAPAPKDPEARKLLGRRVRAMFRVYPKALVGDVEAVHDLRVAARRLRSALTLLAERPEGRRAKRADRALRDLARAAGRGRDLDVGLEILEAAPSAVDDANKRLRRSLRASRARARYLSREALLDLELARLRRDLRVLVATTNVDGPALAARIAELRRLEEPAVDRALSPPGGRPGPEELHAARRAARRLRYAAEIEDLAAGGESGAAARWRTVQTRLGDIQDRHVLGLWLTAAERRAVLRQDTELAAAAARALARVKREAASLTRAFLDSRRTPSPPLPG